MIAGLARAGLDLVFPRACAGCGAGVEGAHRYLCWDCLRHQAFIHEPYCSRCGDPIDGVVDHAVECRYCVSHRVHFTLARSAVRYRGAVRRLLQDFKYRAGVHLAADLGILLVGCVEAHYADLAFDLVLPVPLHRDRVRTRSYNQAQLLARYVGAELCLPALPDALTRQRATGTQTYLNARERRENVRGAFGVADRDAIDGRRILLCDDVMTTGATVTECARTLLDAGAVTVHVVTVARG